MLYTIAVILLVAWLPGFVGIYTIGSFVHVLLVSQSGAFASHELIDLADNFPADGIGAEDHPSDRGSDEQHWRGRKQRVVRQGTPPGAVHRHPTRP